MIMPSFWPHSVAVGWTVHACVYSEPHPCNMQPILKRLMPGMQSLSIFWSGCTSHPTSTEREVLHHSSHTRLMQVLPGHPLADPKHETVCINTKEDKTDLAPDSWSIFSSRGALEPPQPAHRRRAASAARSGPGAPIPWPITSLSPQPPSVTNS